MPILRTAAPYSPIYTLTEDEEDDGGLGCFIGSMSRKAGKSVTLVSIVSLILTISGISFLILKCSGRQNRPIPSRIRVKNKVFLI